LNNLITHLRQELPPTSYQDPKRSLFYLTRQT